MKEPGHMWMSHVTYEWAILHVKEPCHIRTSHVTFECARSHMKSCHMWLIGSFIRDMAHSLIHTWHDSCQTWICRPRHIWASLLTRAPRIMTGDLIPTGENFPIGEVFLTRGVFLTRICTCTHAIHSDTETLRILEFLRDSRDICATGSLTWRIHILIYVYIYIYTYIYIYMYMYIYICVTWLIHMWSNSFACVMCKSVSDNTSGIVRCHVHPVNTWISHDTLIYVHTWTSVYTWISDGALINVH